MGLDFGIRLGAVTVSIGCRATSCRFLHDIGIDIPAQLSAARARYYDADGTQLTAIFKSTSRHNHRYRHAPCS